MKSAQIYKSDSATTINRQLV